MDSLGRAGDRLVFPLSTSYIQSSALGSIHFYVRKSDPPPLFALLLQPKMHENIKNTFHSA